MHTHTAVYRSYSIAADILQTAVLSALSACPIYLSIVLTAPPHSLHHLSIVPVWSAPDPIQLLIVYPHCLPSPTYLSIVSPLCRSQPAPPLLSTLPCHLPSTTLPCRLPSTPSPCCQHPEEKESYGPGCRDYFWLVCRLVDKISAEDACRSWQQVRDSEGQ